MDLVGSSPEFKLRSWHIFFDTRQFATPKDTKKWAKRFESNLIYFQANYVVVAAAVFAYYCLYNPLMLLALSAGFFGSFYIANNPIIRVGDRIFTRRQSVPAVVAGSLLLLFLVSGLTIFIVILISAGLVAVHATLRISSVTMSLSNLIMKWRGESPATILSQIHIDGGNEGECSSDVEEEQSAHMMREARRNNARQRQQDIRAKYSIEQKS
eukprot:Opistho-2@22967